MYPFPNAINRYFSFLYDLGFYMKEKEEDNKGSVGNGYFVFVSSAVGLEIVLDRGQVLMKIGKVPQDRKDWIEWSIILSAYTSNTQAYDFNLDIDSQVKRISELLKQYCLELLNGNFNDEVLHQVIKKQIGKGFLERFLQA